MQIYIFDTSAWIAAWHELYGRAVFPALWDQLSDAVAQGKIFSPRQVCDEIYQQEDELTEWCKARAGQLFKSPNPALVGGIDNVAARIVNKHPKLVSGNHPNAADPYVLAWAEKLPGCVVTQEHPIHRHKMPRVCRTEKIKCESLYRFMKAEKWTFK